MQQDKFDGYYNIDFEIEININDLKNLLIERFPKSNIFIRGDDGELEHRYNNGKFDVWMSVYHLKTDGIYDYEDVKTTTTLEIWQGFQVSPLDIMNFIQELSKKLDSKIYILMMDVEKVSFSFSDYSF